MTSTERSAMAANHRPRQPADCPANNAGIEKRLFCILARGPFWTAATMYLRAAHAETSIPFLHQFIRDNPLGILTTAIKSESYPFIQSSHIPFLLDVPDPSSADGSASSTGVLRGHMARQNPQAKALMDALAQQNQAQAQGQGQEHEQGQEQERPPETVELTDEVLILFNGPHHHYVTPKFYRETKPETGKVAPTWNYSAVQAYGKIRLYSDSPSKSATTSGYLQKQVEELSQFAEKGIMGFQKPWTVAEAPDSYVQLLKKNIIGVEVRIERLQGKVKMSQELKEGDREGVIEGFEKLGTDVGDGIARTVRERS